MKRLIILCTVIVCIVFASCTPKTPKERFLSTPMHSGYNSNLWENKDFLLALGSGWVSQEEYDLICDLDIVESSYGDAIEKAKNILDTLKYVHLGFPFSLPDYCTIETMQSFLKHEVDAYILSPIRKEYHTLPWEDLLISQKDIRFRNDDVYYKDFTYNAYVDTVMNISFEIENSIHEALTQKYGNPVLYSEEQSTYVAYNKDTSIDKNFHYTWCSNYFIIKLQEKEHFTLYNPHYEYYYGQKNVHYISSRLTYTNRITLHSYHKAVKQSKCEYVEAQERKRIEEAERKLNDQKQEAEKHRQDSIKQAKGAMKNL